MNFDKAIKFVLAHEGGYVNDPNDPDGETNFGISKRAYPTLDIKNLTVEQAKDIYRTDYWMKSKVFMVNEDIRLVHFDTSINCGAAKAQEIYSTVGDHLGEYLWLRARHYINLVKNRPIMKKFLLGWMNRINDLYEYERGEGKLTGGNV